MKKTLLIILFAFLSSVASAANLVTPGTLTLTPTFESIAVSCEYSDDDNADMTASVQYREVGGSWKTAHSPFVDRRSVVEDGGGTTSNPRQYEVRTAIFELTRASDYEVKITFSDESTTQTVCSTGCDINTANALATTWSHDQRTYSGTTRTVCSSGCDYTTINNAISGSSSNDIIQVKTGSYAGFTLNKNTIKIEAFDDNNMPSITSNSTISSDYCEIDHLNFSGGDLTISGGATYNVVRYSSFSENGGDYAAIDLPSSGTVVGTLIEYNDIDMSSESQGWEASTGIYFFGGNATGLGAIVVRYNDFTGCWDGVGGNGNRNITAGPGEGSVFNNNTFYSADDDGLELEGRVINNIVYNNLFVTSGNDDIGFAPVSVGPAWTFNNVSNNSGSGYVFKLGNGPSTGPIYIYYWTMSNAGNALSLAGGTSTDNITSKCNILDISIQYVYDRVGDTTIQSDYNLYNQGSNYIKLDSGTNNSLSQWRTYSNANNIYGQQDTYTFTGTISWTNEGGGVFTLESDSDAINACGVTINGITKDITGSTRSAPYDIGAYEYTSGAIPSKPQRVTIHYGTIYPGGD